MSERLPARARRGYALGSVATGSFGTVPGLLLLPYLTDRLGVAAGVAGIIVFLPKAWDVVLNPIAGSISDRSTHPAGRRRPFLLRAGALLAVAFVILFSGPVTPQGLAVGWVILAFVGCATAYAFFQVPYVAMAAELTTGYDERTRLMTWRVAVLAIAILISGGLAPVLRDLGGQTWGYRLVGLFVGGLILAGAVGAWRGTAGISMTGYGGSAPGLREQLRIVASQRDFRALLTAFVVQALASGVMLAGVDYLARVRLGSAGFSSVLFVGFVAPAIAVSAMWQRVGERFGKQTGFVASSVVFMAGALLVWPATSISRWAVLVAVAIVGVGYAGVQIFPLAMLPDVAAIDAQRTGINRIGVFTGVWTAGETLGLALGPFLYAAVLAAGGYVSSTTGDAIQPPSALSAITVGFALVPSLLVAVSLAAIARYGVDEAQVLRDPPGAVR